MLEISDKVSRGIVLSKAREADLRLCFRKCKKLVFSQRGSNGKTNVCYSIDKKTLMELYDSMPKRIEAAFKAK